jgi:uncharacterized coiled-coil DUF342 family protein
MPSITERNLMEALDRVRVERDEARAEVVALRERAGEECERSRMVAEVIHANRVAAHGQIEAAIARVALLEGLLRGEGEAHA